MENRKNIAGIKKSAFWDGFFFVLGFKSNPFLMKVKELKRKTVDDRISDSLEITSNTFGEVYNREISCFNE